LPISLSIHLIDWMSPASRRQIKSATVSEVDVKLPFDMTWVMLWSGEFPSGGSEACSSRTTSPPMLLRVFRKGSKSFATILLDDRKKGKRELQTQLG